MFSDLSDDEIAKLNEKHAAEVTQEFNEFQADIKAGLCGVCKEPLTSFDARKPCQHWLLRPEGFRKKHFKKLFEARRFDQLEGFLRWYVNVKQHPFGAINDLKDEHDGTKIKALTIKYENLEWSFSFSKNCTEGNHGTQGAHYHFQMRVDGLPLHDYSDGHIKLSKYELWLLEIEQGKHPKLMKSERYGMGMQGLLDNTPAKDILKSLKNTDDPGKAHFHTNTILMADEGHTISGDDIADMLEESKRTGAPMHQLVKRLKHVRTRVIIEPGPGVPTPAERKQTRRRSKRTSKGDNA